MKTNDYNTQKKVSFLIAGAQKAGTTALYSYLKLHPQICMANKKEVHFFDNERYFDKDNPDYELYHQNFSPNSRDLLLGEATPIYSYWTPAIKRIYHYNKKMKFIILLRNPVERAYSHWNMESKNFYSNQSKHNNKQAVETLTFHQAIHAEKERLRRTAPLQHRYYSYIDRGFYFQQLKMLLTYFPRNQLLILKSDWLRYNPTHTLKTIFNFLDINEKIEIHQLKIKNNRKKTNRLIVNPADNTKENPANTGSYTSKISDIDRKYLIDIFKEDIKSLEKLLNWNCNNWLE